jgi:AIR synthase related protein, C-terminal domain
MDSTSHRHPADLRHLTGIVAATAPHAAKDVSMAGVVGTVGMMAEASGCSTEITIGDVPRPSGAALGDWLTCFPGFAMVTADTPGRAVSTPAPATSNPCGSFAARADSDALVTIRWPDGETTPAITGTVTGLAPAEQEIA